MVLPDDHPVKAMPSDSSGPNTQNKEREDENTDGQDSDMKDIGHGIMLVVTAPIALAGMCVYACGTILEGTAKILKGAGAIGRKPMDYAMAASTASRE